MVERTPRVTSPAIPLLDHGFVQLIDMMGDDHEPARAARMSHGKYDEVRAWGERNMIGGKFPRNSDGALTEYLWTNRHTTPFEMVELKWMVKLPIFVARQWVRHRTANINEFSMRYADPTEISEFGSDIEYYTPPEWRISDPTNRQGSVPAPVGHNLHPSLHGDLAFDIYRNAHEKAIQAYKDLHGFSVAGEIARGVLPVSTYTKWIWKNDLWNTIHFLNLRADSHAQKEIQVYADAMVSVMREKLPLLMEVVWPEK